MRLKMTPGVCGLAMLTMLSGATAQTTQERREELLKVQEMISDPDPLMRVANFEAIVKDRDKLKTEMAIKLAMSSQDAALRSLATSAYFAMVGKLTLDLVLPAEQKRLWENVKDDRQRRNQAMQDNRSINTVGEIERGQGGRVRFVFTDIRIGSNSGTVAYSSDGVKPRFGIVPYRVLGERLVFSSEVFVGNTTPPCDIELRGTRDLTIIGTMTCQNGNLGPVGLQAQMF